MSDLENPYRPSGVTAAASPLQIAHSGFGITGFILSLTGAVGGIVTIFFGVIMAHTPESVDERAVSDLVIGLSIIGFGILSVIAFGLSFGSMFQSTRKKLFGILGMVISGILIMGICGIMLLGIAVS